MEETTDWKILESRYVIETPHLRLRRDSIELPSGTRIDEYYVRETAGFAIVFALTPRDEIVLVRQYKHGIGEGVLELPAGAIEPGESPTACAVRELAEETGYVGSPEQPEFVSAFISDPTNSNGRFYLYLVRNAQLRHAQRLDPTEEITVELATFDDVRRFVRNGEINVGPNVAAIYFMLDRLGKL
ncbi:MAG TPA: NUDIX hydrolase [Candidatus Acidoferrales bacterium]|nr:NUDIX hydrolase [Candidatus Acidoferrales bacterium]